MVAMNAPERNTGSRTIADALAQRESGQMDALEDLVAQAMADVAAVAAGQPVEVVQKLLADRLRPHLPVDSKSNESWLRERAKLVVAAQQCHTR